ncbi:hypothetical protein ABZ502_17690 [Streptomyces abikoensis]|uniref:hypothetical protein n=1 Tax=Streptomyces abikoensis TaxID=97398 RepID=UPI0033FD2171
MLEIGLHGLAFALTFIVIAALKKGGKSVKSEVGLGMGIILGYAHARAGEPWSILSDKAKHLLSSIGAEVGGASAAAITVAIAGWWWYARPGAKGSVVWGYLLISAAATASGLLGKIEGIVGHVATIIAG